MDNSMTITAGGNRAEEYRVYSIEQPMKQAGAVASRGKREKC